MPDDARPHVIVIAGLDPGGGAGLVRDAATLRRLGTSYQLVPTAFTEQTTAAAGAQVTVEPRPPALVAMSLARACAAAPPSTAVKIGMLATADIAAAVALALTGFPGKVVLDPVLATTSGGALLRGPGAPLDWLAPLLARADLVTPNRDEANALTGIALDNADDAQRAAARLRAAGAAAVLVKGGHMKDSGDGLVSDLLFSTDAPLAITGPRLPGPSPRGTGCALASAIAAFLAAGDTLPVACRQARAWLAGQIANAVTVGRERHLPG